MPAADVDESHAVTLELAIGPPQAKAGFKVLCFQSSDARPQPADQPRLEPDKIAGGDRVRLAGRECRWRSRACVGLYTSRSSGFDARPSAFPMASTVRDTTDPDPAQCPRVEPRRASDDAEVCLTLRHEFAYAYACDALRGARSVLEVGCGEGYGASTLARSFSHVHCVDIGRDVLERAKSSTSATNVAFSHYDGVRLPFADRSFDGLVSFQVIEHVADPVAFVRELARVLKPGASAVLTTPSRTYRLDPGQAPWNRFHLREYTAAEFGEVLRSAFPAVAVRGIRGSPRAQTLEHARVRPAREGRKRRVAPPRTGFMGWLDKVRAVRRKDAPFGPHDFAVIDADLDVHSLDLLAVCTARG